MEEFAKTTFYSFADEENCRLFHSWSSVTSDSSGAGLFGSDSHTGGCPVCCQAIWPLN